MISYLRSLTRDDFLVVIGGSTGIFIYLWVFYHSIILSIIFCFLGLLLPIRFRKEKATKWRQELLLCFQLFLGRMSDGMKAGMSFERALRKVVEDYSKSHKKSGKHFYKELERALENHHAGTSIEGAFLTFAESMKIPEIERFARTLPVVLRKGGRGADYMRSMSEVIGEKNKAMEEIRVLLAEKQMEKKMVDWAPLLMMYMLSVTSPEFIQPVFQTWEGRIAITVAQGFFVLAWALSGKIMNISV